MIEGNDYLYFIKVFVRLTDKEFRNFTINDNFVFS